MGRRPVSGIGLLAGAVLLAWVAVRGGLSGQTAPDFSLREAYGGRVDLQSYRGRPVLLVFWTTSCGICRYELPMLDRLALEFRSKGVEVAAINLGDLDGAREFMRSKQLRLTNLVDPDDTVARAYRVSGVPKLVLVGADGKIKWAREGRQSERVVRRWLEAAARG